MRQRIGVIRLPVNRLHLELTNLCNFSCEFCPDGRMTRPRGLMPAQRAKSILDQLSGDPLFRMVHLHVMGEPTLHPQLLPIAEHARSRGAPVALTTNGTRLDREMLDSLERVGVRRIIISLQTPDERSFALRGARGTSFPEYSERVVAAAGRFLDDGPGTRLTVSFLSSPLRRLFLPLAAEFRIADTATELRALLALWAEKILRGTPAEGRLPGVLDQVRRAGRFRENQVSLGGRLSFHTRVAGAWATHLDQPHSRARIGYCPGLQENLGILWNGDYVFCCADYDGRTATANADGTSIRDYLASDPAQRVVRGFNRFQVVHPYCRSCLGEASSIPAFCKQLGSILYFKALRRRKAMISP